MNYNSPPGSRIQCRSDAWADDCGAIRV